MHEDIQSRDPSPPSRESIFEDSASEKSAGTQSSLASRIHSFAKLQSADVAHTQISDSAESQPGEACKDVGMVPVLLRWGLRGEMGVCDWVSRRNFVRVDVVLCRGW